MKDYFKNKVVLVTGGASGIGQALACALFSEGGRVLIIDNQEDALRNFKDNHKDIPSFLADIRGQNGLQSVMEQIINLYGIPDMVINNAGVFIAGEARDLDNRQWKECIEVNLLGMINLISILYPLMAKRKSGQIVNIASMVGLAPVPLIIPYVTSKYGITGLTRSLRIEAQSLGVKVNLVCPGRLDSGLLEKSEAVNTEKELFISQLPFKPYPLGKAAAKILKGIRKNKKIIVFPWYVYTLWYTERISNRLLLPLYAMAIKRFRKIRETKE